MDFVDGGRMVCCKDRVKIDGFPCQEGEPLFFGELWALRRVGEALFADLRLIV